MWRKRVDVFHEPHCEIMSEDMQIAVPVCRDKIKEKVERIYRWSKEGWDFEKIQTSEEECRVCEEPLLKAFLYKIFRR
jgi:hypothetical protein